MNNNHKSIKLIEWQIYQSKLTDAGARLFALSLCKHFADGQANIQYTDQQIANVAMISLRSVPTYIKKLVESGEWAVKPVRKVGTTYTPLFLDEIPTDETN